VSDPAPGRHTGPGRVRLFGALLLPPRRPRVIAIGLHDAGGRAASLQRALGARLHAGGWYTPEQRPWLAHVSVARIGRGRGAPGAGRAAGDGSSAPRLDPVALERALRSPVPLDPFPAEAVLLMRSRPGSHDETLTRLDL
jgi:hypothetical protein